MDDLGYTYTNGNQLNQVEDTSLDEKGFKNGANINTMQTETWSKT